VLLIQRSCSVRQISLRRLLDGVLAASAITPAVSSSAEARKG